MSGGERIYLLVSLRARGLTALTAEETIRRRVAGGDALERLDQADLWEFRHRGEKGFREELEKLVRESNLFVNPNKHSFRFTEEYRTGWAREAVLLTVRGREDLEGEVARETLGTRYRLEGLEEVRYSTLWVVRFKDVAGDEALARAEALAVTTGPKGGLLVNPHFQEYAVEPATGTGEVTAK